MLRLLLLSDIHFLALCEEMDPHCLFRKKFLEDVEDYRREIGAIDHILVCGDIACRGAAEEYEAADRFFEQLCEKVACKPEEIYIVPGNHDKDFTAPNAGLRHLIDAGLANEGVDSDKLFIDLLTKDFAQFKTLYHPFKAYQDFAVKKVSTEPLMTKCLDDGCCEAYDNDRDKAYMATRLGSIGDYMVQLYAMNTSLNADRNDVNDFGKGHKLFLPKLSYNIHPEKEGCINIAMMHHPTANLANGEQVASVLDASFQIQIFGHLHKPVSDSRDCIHIHSGALQPPNDEKDESVSYFSVYNILELDVINRQGKDILSVQLRVEQYDANRNAFVEMQQESKHFDLPLKKHVNRWKMDSNVNVLPATVTERTVKYKFLQLNNPKAIIDRMSSYDENKSHNKNCVDFLSQMQAEHRLAELWKEINKE